MEGETDTYVIQCSAIYALMEYMQVSVDASNFELHSGIGEGGREDISSVPKYQKDKEEGKAGACGQKTCERLGVCTPCFISRLCTSFHCPPFIKIQTFFM